MQGKAGEDQKKEKSLFYQTFDFALQLGYAISVPLVLLALLGRFLDKRYGASPIFLLSGIILAILISGFLVFRKAKKILDEADD